ncbi:MAG: cytochrome bc complex cytochrome b subunit [Fimbriimonadaceae bacterium]|nr:cytochrome bc complex cytochrome b subunit [Fimbriimonadaceae bacterium]
MASEALQGQGKFWTWFDDQVRLLKKKIAAVDLFDETLADQAASNPWYALGSMVYFFWLTTIVTGLMLIAWYIPNTSRAFDSILHIQEGIPGGWLIRGLHKYAADAIIIAATMRVYRLYFTGEYKTREIAWLVSIITLILGMFSGLTGYLLMWNQRAFWASKVFATFPTYIDEIPILGQLHLGMTTAQFMLGGTAIGDATLTRFYAGHFAMSMLLLIPVEAYFIRKGFKRISLSWLTMGVCLAMLTSVAFLIPVELGSRANRAETPLPILSDWYFLGLYQMMKEMKPLYAVIGTMFIPAIAILMPAFDTAKDVPTWRRPFFLSVGLAAFIHWLLLSLMIIKDYAQITTDPPKIWASWIVIMLCGACFEYKAMGYPRKAVTRRVVLTLLGWAVLFATFAGWTRFRQPPYTASYLPAAMHKLVVDESPEVRDERNGRYSGDDPATVRDEILNAISRPIVSEWYVASPSALEKLKKEQDGVRGCWVMMTMALLLCGLVAIATTPTAGIESLIYPSRTPRGRKIKGLGPPPKPAATAEPAAT